MIQTKRGLFLVAILTVVVATVITFPARIAYHWASSPDVAASGIRGTVWRGSADAVAVEGVTLLDVSWRIRPLHLLTGKASYRIGGSPVSGFFECIASIGIGGTVTLSDVAASLPLQMFAEVLGIRGLEGDASLKFEQIKIRDDLPVAADGVLEVVNLLAPILSRESIGGYRAEFATQSNGISASVEDTDGAVDLAGSFQLNDDRSYEFLGQVVAKPATPDTLQRQMQYLGSANERGQREVRFEGSL